MKNQLNRTVAANLVESINFDVGRAIRARRQLLGMTQGQLAQHVGVSFQQIQKYESGDNRISVGRLVLLAQVLGVSEIALIGSHARYVELAPQAVDRLSAAKERVGHNVDALHAEDQIDNFTQMFSIAVERKLTAL